MKVTLGQLVNAMPVLGKLSDEALPVKDSYRLAKLIRKVSVETDIYDKERIKLCERYGKKNETENLYDISDKEGFEASFSQLIVQETELDFEPFPLPDSVKLSAAEIMAVEDFFKFDFEAEEV